MLTRGNLHNLLPLPWGLWGVCQVNPGGIIIFPLGYFDKMTNSEFWSDKFGKNWAWGIVALLLTLTKGIIPSNFQSNESLRDLHGHAFQKPLYVNNERLAWLTGLVPGVSGVVVKPRSTVICSLDYFKQYLYFKILIRSILKKRV